MIPFPQEKEPTAREKETWDVVTPLNKTSHQLGLGMSMHFPLKMEGIGDGGEADFSLTE